MQLNGRQISAFLMYRMTDPENTHTIEDLFPQRIPIRDSEALVAHLRSRVTQAADGRAALALSGGIDSAILAKFMPKGSVAYTFKCVVPGIKVTDETPAAARYARECGLEHRIVEVYWQDFEKYADVLMRHKHAPIHSIEVQIYKACLQAKADGFDTLIFGEAADAVYGGLSGLLSRDWPAGEFIQRYSFVMPHLAVREPEYPIGMFRAWERDGHIDPHDFVSHVFIEESVASYINPARASGVSLVLPYPETYLAAPMDYVRIRSGENKYLIREVFQKLYPGFPIPEKTPMPRPMNEWLRDWTGPEDDRFWPGCTQGLTGDQKWMLWSLDHYLRLNEDRSDPHLLPG